MEVIEFIKQPWPWYVSGTLIAINVFIMTFMGRKFGISGYFEAMCSYVGAGKFSDYFRRQFDETWRMYYLIGTVIGGFIASHYLQHTDPIAISQATIAHLKEWGIDYSHNTNKGYLPTEIFNFSFKGILLALISGILIGFGTRYGKGCTSGHAITGLSHLKIESLVTVIGFFIGGLVMTWLIMPLIFG